MDEKKSISISVTAVFLFLAIIVIIAMGYYIYIQNTKYHTDIANLEKTIINVQSTISNPSAKAPETSTTVSFTDAEVKTALSNYLDLITDPDDGYLVALNEKGNLNYDSSKNTINNDGTETTSVKFSDYKNAMLNYVSEDEFERNWSTSIHIFEDKNGFLTIPQGGGGSREYTINKITKINDTTYRAETTAYLEMLEESEPDNFIFVVTSSNGKCVIDHI